MFFLKKWSLYNSVLGQLDRWYIHRYLKRQIKRCPEILTCWGLSFLISINFTYALWKALINVYIGVMSVPIATIFSLPKKNSLMPFQSSSNYPHHPRWQLLWFLCPWFNFACFELHIIVASIAQMFLNSSILLTGTSSVLFLSDITLFKYIVLILLLYSLFLVWSYYE